MPHRAYTMVLGNTMNLHEVFMDRLNSNMKLREVYSMNDCDVIIAFVPIVSRAGTDIQAALEKIPRHSYKHIIMVCLHHTFDPDYIAPDSRYSVSRDDVFAVDCLYHEDQGLLKCQSNNVALKRVIKHLGGENPSNQVSELSWLSGVDTIELISWAISVLSIFLFCFFLPEGYNVFTFFILDLFLLIVIGVGLTYYGCGKWVWVVCISINLVVFVILVSQSSATEKQDLQESLSHHHE